MKSQLHGTGGTARYAAILGASPSKGARSPLLWNTLFSALNIDCVFGAYDIAEEELESVVGSLKGDPTFIGGAVAVPYKTSIIPFLDELEPEAEKIGAVNALYRRGKNLVGANTDGQGAIASLLSFVGDPNWLYGKKILLLGTGGAGCAVATYLAKNCDSTGVLWLTNRTESKAEALAGRLSGYDCRIEVLAYHEIFRVVSETRLLVNCTTVGSMDQRESDALRLLHVLSTPLVDMDEPLAPDGSGEVASTVANAVGENVASSLAMLSMLPQRAVVFDVIYRPTVTMLLRLAGSLGLPTLNGRGMNLEQAVIACHEALLYGGLWKAESSKDVIRKVMSSVP